MGLASRGELTVSSLEMLRRFRRERELVPETDRKQREVLGDFGARLKNVYYCRNLEAQWLQSFSWKSSAFLTEVTRARCLSPQG